MPRRLLFLLLISAAVALTAACSDDDPGATADAGAGGCADLLSPKSMGLTVHCPGSAGCASNAGDLYAGVAQLSISPAGFEAGRVAYYKEESFCPSPTPTAPLGLARCGQLLDQAMWVRKDCGTDGVCPGDKITTRKACDATTPCPAGLSCDVSAKRCLLSYTAPDKDGSESDGQLDWFLDCGRDRICPCKDAEGEPAYYGPGGKACLKGHSKNSAYKAPDADGSEGDGAFQGIWMGGFDGNHPLLGVHDPIWARALVLRTGDVTVAIVSLDLVGLFYDRVKEIRAKVAVLAKEAGVDYVLVSSTHNHEGPDTMGQWGINRNDIPTGSGVDSALMAHIIDQSANAVATAAAGLKKATLKVGQVKTPREGYIRDSRDPQIFDLDLTVVSLAEASGGAPISTLVHWGNHPEVLSDNNNYLSSDFSHYLREALEKGLPAKGTHEALPALGGTGIYLQGALGCLMTPLGITITDRAGVAQSRSDWAKAQALGENLAMQAHAALAKAEVVKSPLLSVAAKELLLPAENTQLMMILKLKIFEREVTGYNPNLPVDKNNRPHVRTELSLIRLGPATFFSLPGEADPETMVGGYDGKLSYGASLVDKNNKNPPDLTKAPKGPFLKEKVPGTYKMMVGLGNDEIGYLVPPWNFQLGSPPYISEAPGDHYTEVNSLGPGTVPALLSAYEGLLKKYK